MNNDSSGPHPETHLYKSGVEFENVKDFMSNLSPYYSQEELQEFFTVPVNRKYKWAWNELDKKSEYKTCSDELFKYSLYGIMSIKERDL